MALDINCVRCKRELEAPGALVFSSPLRDKGNVKKWHVCVNCETALIKFLCGFPIEGIETNDPSDS